jgi:hypothetical protein
MTVEDDSQSKPDDEEIAIKLGVFLCTRKNEDDDNEDGENEDEKKENFHISLLWHSKTHKLEDGSRAFGRLPRRACDFSSWQARLEKGKKALKYKYFSSNGCRVGDDVSCLFH